jgi:spore coat protein H
MFGKSLLTFHVRSAAHTLLYLSHEPEGTMTARRAVAVVAMALCACGHKEDEEAKDETKYQFEELQREVPLYELSISPEVMAKFDADPWTDEQDAVFRAGGQSYAVKVRLRGSSSRFFEKKSWRIELPDGVDFDGRDDINLIAEYQDSTYVTEKLAYDLLAAMGAPAPRAKFVRLNVNGQYEGVFVDLEHIDKHFLRAHGFADADANIYRCGYKDCELKTWRTYYQTDWEKKTNEKEPMDDVRAFVEMVNRAPEPKLVESMREKFDADGYLKTMAMDALISNDIQQDSRSYFIHDKVTGKWTYVPWDLNNNDARWWPTYELGMHPIVDHPLYGFSAIDGWVQRMHDRRKTQIPGHMPAFSNLTTRFAFNPDLKKRANDTIEHAVTDLFEAKVIEGRIDAMYDLIAPYVKDDPYTDHAKFAEGRDYLKAFASKRADYLRLQVKQLREAKPMLVIDRVDPKAKTIDLKNRGEVGFHGEGLVLTSNLRDALNRNVPAIDLKAGESMRFTAAQLGINLDPAGEVGLYNGSSVAGAIDVFFYGALDGGRVYERDGEGRWQIR